MANEQMRDFWDGQGAEWVRHHEIFDRMLAPFGAAVVEALAPRPGESILDVGCGFGTTMAAILETGASVAGVDISAPMVEAAAQRVPAATAFVADAQTDPLRPGAPYDGVLSRFGVMFFDEPVAAFRNIGAATRAGGRLAFVCWRALAENPLFGFGLPRLRAALPDPPPIPDPLAPGPFAFADADRVRTILGEAGWTDVSIEPLDAPVVFGGDGRDPVDDVMTNLGRHPLARALEVQVSTAVRERVFTDLRADVAVAARDGRLEFSGAAWLVTAHR